MKPTLLSFVFLRWFRASLMLLALAGASPLGRAYVFSDPNNLSKQAPNSEMFGDASFRSGVAGYFLSRGSSGIVIFNTSQVVYPGAAVTDFQAGFDVDMYPLTTGTSGQIAFALNYGVLTDGPINGNINVGNGLVIACTSTNNPTLGYDIGVRITLRGTVIAHAFLAQQAQITRFDASLTATTPPTLTVKLGAVNLVSPGPIITTYKVFLPQDWNPSPHWRFGITGASTGPRQFSLSVDRVSLSATTKPWYSLPLESATPYTRSSFQDFPDSFQFNVGSHEGVPSANITVTATSSDPSLFPPSGLSVVSPQASSSPELRQINLTPSPGAKGTATITLLINPGGGLPTSTVSYQQTVLPNIPPSITALLPAGATLDQPFGFTRILPFSISSPHWPPSKLSLAASAGNSLVDPTALFVQPASDNGTDWNLVLTPRNDAASGTVSGDVQVTVTDGSRDTATTKIPMTVYNPKLPPAVLGGGSALALNPFGPSFSKTRQYAEQSGVTDTGSGGTATIEAWVFATSLPDPFLNVIASVGTPSETTGIILAVQGDGSPSFANWLNDFYPTNATIKISTNRWHHLAGVVNGRAVSLYVDGQLSAKGTLNQAANLQPKYVLLGHEPFEDNLDRPWCGYLDNIRIWKTARSAADIADNFDRLVPSDAPGLVRDFRCEEGFVHFDGANPALKGTVPLGGVLQDFSAQQQPATLAGFPSFVAGVPLGTTVNVAEDAPTLFGLGAGINGTNVWGTAGAARELFFGPITNAIAAGLLQSTGWPTSPAVVQASGSGLEILPGGPAGYGQRFRGWLLPPESGTYTFAIASAGEGMLLLSSDDSEANLAPIARSPATGVGFRRFDFNRPLQTATYNLTAGRRYYFEVRHQADAGANGSAHLCVRWTLPSGLVETPIPAHRFLPVGPSLPGDSLDFSLEVPPAYGSLTLNGGRATYTPVSNYFGTDSFVYRAVSAGITSAPVVVNLTVVNRDDAPVAGSGNALRLAGGSSAAATDDAFNLSGGSFTLELWARRANSTPPAAGTAQVLWHLAPEPAGATNSQALFAWQPDGTVAFSFPNSPQDSPLVSGTPYLDTRWHHWAVSFNASTGHREIFLDGVSVNQDISTQTPPSLVQLFLGARNGRSDFFTGDIDEVRLWTRARSVDEITTTMTVPLAGKEDDLFAYFRLDEGNGLSSRDSSPAKPGGVFLNLDLTNPVTWLPGVTNLNVVKVPQNSPGQSLFLPGFDPDGQTLTWQIFSSTNSNGRLDANLASPGTFLYTPNTNFHGLDSILYRVTAGGRTSAVATVLIQVERLPIPPVISSVRDVEMEEEDPPLAVALALADAEDASGNSLVLSARSSNNALLPPNRITFSGRGNTRTATLDPVEGEIGTASVEIEVSNGEKSSVTKFEVRVNPRLAYVVVNAGESTSLPSGVATALNDAGQLAGWLAGTAAQTNSQPFFYSGFGAVTPTYLANNLGGSIGGALGINDDGLIVGSSQNAQGARRAFAVDPRRDTKPTDLGVLPGGNDSVATAVNGSGLVIGYAQVGDNTYRAFTAGTAPITSLALTNGYAEMWATAVNDAGEIVGFARRAADGATNAFLHAAGQTLDLGRPPSASHVVVTAINEGGTIFGHALYPSGAASRAVRWDDGQWTELGDLLGGGRTEVTGANRYGQIVGRALTTNGVWHAFYAESRGSGANGVWHAFDLNALLASQPDWTIDTAAAINDRGQIAATGRRQGDTTTQALLLFPATEIGRRVFRPEGTLPELPTITILQGGGQDTPDKAFFWSVVDRKLFAIRPVVAEIRWRTGTYEVVTNLTEFGDTFIRQKFTNEITLPTLSFNVWPASPDLHVVGTPVQVEPDQDGFQFGFVERIHTTADGATVDAANKVFTSPSTGYTVLHYLKTEGLAPNPDLQPHQFSVVRSVAWNDPLVLVTNVPWTIGLPITNALHNDYPGLNGFILFTNAPYDGAGASAAYDRARRAGPILPVNTHTEGGNLVVVWYRQNRLGVAWSDLPYQYNLSWPTNAPKIVIASQLGSGPLSPSQFPQPRVYSQPDDKQPGFNPNEEHALMVSGVLYALRDDLNERINPKASDAFTLLKYRDPASGEWRMQVYEIVAEWAPWFFRYDGVAGNEIQPPLPLSALPAMTRNNKVAFGPAWQDYEGKFYARAAGFLGGEGEVVMRWYYPMQPDFFYHVQRTNGRPPEYQTGDAVPWLDRRTGGVSGQPIDVTYSIEWPPTVPALRVGQSLTTATGGLPDIADMAAAQVVFDSLDPTGNQPAEAVARLFDPLSPRTVTLEEGFRFPTSIRRSVDPTTGFEAFPDLPFHLRVRLFHDPRNHRLGFRGYVYTPPDGGASITLVNVMSSRERETIAALANPTDSAFDEIIKTLYLRTLNPNQVDLDGDGKPEEEWLVGLTMRTSTNNAVVTRSVVPETLLGPKALAAGRPLPALLAPNSGAVRFDGTDASLQVGTVFTNVTDTFTLEFWVKPEAARGDDNESITGASGLHNQRYAVFPTQGQTAYGSGHAGAGVSVGTNGVAVYLHSDYLIAPPLVYTTNIVGWHHVAVVYQQRQPLLYLDGQLVHVGLASPQVIHPSADLSSNPSSPSYGPFIGSISDLRVWSYARTPTEIALNRNQRLTGAEDRLAGLWRFDETSGTRVADASPGQNAGSLVGSYTWTTDAPDRAPASRYVVVAENGDPSLAGLPVSLHVLRVDDTLAPGTLALILPDNVLDERVTVRHSADFAGQPEHFVFEWYYQFDAAQSDVSAPNFDPTQLPVAAADGELQLGSWLRYPSAGPGVNDVTLGADADSSLLTLSDTWWVMRYGVANGDGKTNWSAWVGDPAGTEAAPRAMLVPGWIKRVLGGINLFAQRSSDFQNNTVNTLASTIAEAGPRYSGDVALNPGVLDNFGLIEIYETILRRGRSLSIDGTPAVDFPPADQALLLAAGRIADLYLLHANEAFADAADPTVGLTTDSTELGSLASSAFAFENQTGSLLEEELALLRGRDDRSGGVGAAPVFNRLLWNFTGSEGEVAYVATYGIPDQNSDGFINAADARILFPQGHGDAWGHYLTALTTYYDLLRHPHFTWTPRAQSTLVAGISIEVNYEDERRFALAAATKARTGAEIVDRTRRLDYADDPVAQFRGTFDPDPQRAWSTSDWARRAALGAYFDWVAGNAILPPVDPDPSHSGIQRVDRTTVQELTQIVDEASVISATLDQADVGLNPAGLARGVVPFDIDPDQLRTGFTRVTHFEQVYQRALQALQNAEVTFNRATLLSSELRKQQNSVSDYSVAVAGQEAAFLGDLISIFGYPYSGDTGPGTTYPSDYQGPDLLHWMYIDTLDVTPANTPPGEGLGEIRTQFLKVKNDWQAEFSSKTLDTLDPQSTTNEQTVEFPVSAADYAFETPESWGSRRAEGRLQSNLRQLVLAQAQSRAAVGAYGILIQQLEHGADLLDLRYGLRRDQLQLITDKLISQTTFNGLIIAAKTTKAVFESMTESITDAIGATIEAIPDVEGLSDDAFAPIAAAAYLTGNFTKSVPEEIAEAAELAEAVLDLAKEEADLAIELVAATKEQDFELTERLKELEGLVHQESSLRLDLFNANQAIIQAARDIETTLTEGQRLLSQRTVFRQITAGTIQADRYRDLGLRIFRNDALQKYEAQFNLAARYVHLAAAAYDYELNLGTDAGAGSALGAQIVRERSLGELADGEPVVGRVGLASMLGRMRQNFDVLKGQLGLNNDRPERTRFSLRTEAFRILPTGTNATDNANWQSLLQKAAVTNLWDVPEFRRHCRPFAPESAGPQPGLVLRFSTTVTAGQNFFGQPLGPLDSSYDPSESATRVKSLAVWLSNYDNAGLSARPRVYLIPVGTDRLRTSAAQDFTLHDWQVLDQRIPVPYPISATDLGNANSLPLSPSADGSFTDVRRHSAFRAYPDGAFDVDDFNESSRLVGRSVWNTQWVLIIPGAYLLGGDQVQQGLDRFIQSVDDIKLFFQTYSVSGN